MCVVHDIHDLFFPQCLFSITFNITFALLAIALTAGEAFHFEICQFFKPPAPFDLDLPNYLPRLSRLTQDYSLY